MIALKVGATAVAAVIAWYTVREVRRDEREKIMEELR